MKHYATRTERDRARRHSLSYRLKFWFWSNHTKEVQAVSCMVGLFAIGVLWFGAVIFFPHFFR